MPGMMPPMSFAKLRITFWVASVVTMGYFLWMNREVAPLNSRDVIQFEVAKTASNAVSLIESWKAAGKYDAGVESIYLDYIFILFYGISIALGCRFFSVITKNDILIKGGRGFSFLIWFACAADITENLAMTDTIHNQVRQSIVTLAYNMARIKFSILIVCLLFLVACFLYWAISVFLEKK